jgi:hypothetical protein
MGNQQTAPMMLQLSTNYHLALASSELDIKNPGFWMAYFTVVSFCYKQSVVLKDDRYAAIN